MINPIVWRFKMCSGCKKTNNIIPCPVYAEPHKTYYARNNTVCPFNPPVVEDKKKGFVNPIKSSKRNL